MRYKRAGGAVLMRFCTTTTFLEGTGETEAVEDPESIAPLFRQVLFINAGVMHVQRTQVYSQLTVAEFEQACRGPSGSYAAVRLAGKEAAMYGPATAVFPPPPPPRWK